MRALVVSNMLPDGAAPERGRFVRDQVAALQRLEGLDVELYEFPPGPRELGRAFSRLRRRFGSSSASTASAIGGPPFDVVHAHFGLSAWAARAVPARVRALTLHGTDVNHPRTRLLTLAALPFIDVLGTASASLAEELPPRWARRRAQPLPCGVDVERFHPIDRERARAELGLRPEGRYVLFPADPARPEKRHDRALALAAACDAELLVLGGVDPEQVPRWVNAANAVVVPSEREGFGLAALEALACDVPVLATPVGVHAEALAGVDGALCAAFDLAGWSAALSPHLHARDPRVQGRARALLFSSTEMAARVAAAWSEALERSV